MVTTGQETAPRAQKGGAAVLKRLSVFTTGILCAVILLAALITYTVQFDETVIVTTFGSATASAVKNADGNSPGIYLKWPWPIQEVIRFDRRVALLHDRLEQQQTQDRQVIVVKAYLAWKIRDPLTCYRMFRTTARMETFLTERLRSSKSVLGSFSFDELVATDSTTVRMYDASEAMLSRIRGELVSHESGIDVVTAGIHRLVLPENNTRTVFDRMKQTRQRFAQNARSEGAAIAQSITAKTDSDKQRILAFSERIAQQIRAEGDAAAARYYRTYARDPEFALFLRKLDAITLALEKNTTYVLDSDSEPFDVLRGKKHDRTR